MQQSRDRADQDVELRPVYSDATQLSSGRVELSCVAINAPCSGAIVTFVKFVRPARTALQ